MFSKPFLTAALERALKTAAQSALLVIGAEQVDALTVDWLGVLGFAAGGAVLSVLSSLASAGVGNPGPSLVRAETLTAAPPA